MKPRVLYKDKLHEKRKKGLIFKLFLVFMGLAALGGFMLYLIFFAEFFDLREIEINGNKTVSNNEIKDVLEKPLAQRTLFLIPIRFNIFAIDTDTLGVDILNSFPKFEKVSVSKKPPHMIEVKILEKEPLGTWCFNKNSDDNSPISAKCFYFDKYFTAFETAPYLSGSIYLHVTDYLNDTPRLGEKVAKSDWAEKIAQTDGWLKSNLGINMKEVIIPENSFDEFNIETEDGWKIFMAKSLDITYQLESLKIFITQKFSLEELKNLEYIDARVENRFYYK